MPTDLLRLATRHSVLLKGLPGLPASEARPTAASSLSVLLSRFVRRPESSMLLAPLCGRTRPGFGGWRQVASGEPLHSTPPDGSCSISCGFPLQGLQRSLIVGFAGGAF